MIKTILKSISMMNYKSGINIKEENEYTPEYKSSNWKSMTATILFYIFMAIALIYSINKKG